MHLPDFRRRGAVSVLLVAPAALMAIGLVMIASTTASLDRPFESSLIWPAPLVRSAAFVAVAMLAMLIGSRIDVGRLRWRPGSLFQPAIAILATAGTLLALVWVSGIGVESHGRKRWIDLGPIGFQPSEFAKLALVIVVAALLSRPRSESRAAPRLLAPILAIAVLCLLVGIEDFGTAALLAMVGLVMLIVGGCSLGALAAWTMPALGGFAYLLFSHPYRVERLTNFLRIWEDPHGAGYHPIQSLAAIASGGWFGQGLGSGLSKFGYLPESRSDFVFAVICEETGVLGGSAVIALFVVLMIFGARVMLRAGESDGGFRRLFAFGMTTMIGLQALLNIAVVTVVAPTKGIALPFVSAGGSGIICYALAMGLLAGVERTAEKHAAADKHGLEAHQAVANGALAGAV